MPSTSMTSFLRPFTCSSLPEVADFYRRRFRHILVDEYQDTNPAQYALIKALAGDGPAAPPVLS